MMSRDKGEQKAKYAKSALSREERVFWYETHPILFEQTDKTQQSVSPLAVVDPEEASR